MQQSERLRQFFFCLSQTSLFPENLQSVKPRVRAEPDEPKAPSYQSSDTPFRLRIDSLQSITNG